MKRKLFILVFSLICFADTVQAKIWYVVQGGTIPDPKTASGLAQDGDTIDIAYNAMPYLAYETKWPQHNLLIRGSGSSRPVLKAESFSVTQKAIFVTQGNDIVIENIEFANCKVPDKNGAGIRVEGVNLTVRDCKFTKNEMGILAGDKQGSTITVENCEFAFSGYGDGYSHNIYINHVENFIFRFNYSHDSKIGHLVKSRAYNNYILYNRLDSPENGTPSREIDLPNGGIAIIIGNVIRQTLSGENSNLIGYGLEGLSNPAPHVVCINNNTIINEKTNGSFVHLQSGTEFLKMTNNIFAGGGNLMNGAPAMIDTFSNIRVSDIQKAGFVDATGLDFHLSDTSIAINKGSEPGKYNNFDLIAYFEYVDLAKNKERKFIGKIDAGAFESDISTGLSQTDKIMPYFARIGDCIINTNFRDKLHLDVFTLNGILTDSFDIGYNGNACLNHLTSGIYILNITASDNYSKSIKFIKH